MQTGTISGGTTWRCLRAHKDECRATGAPCTCISQRALVAEAMRCKPLSRPVAPRSASWSSTDGLGGKSAGTLGRQPTDEPADIACYTHRQDAPSLLPSTAGQLALELGPVALELRPAMGQDW
jgi:hypothetical protein